VLAEHSAGLRVTSDTPKMYELTAHEVELLGQKRQGVYFASVLEAKNDTAFYFFPIYTHPDRFEDLSPRLRKKMTGKSCFHVSKADPKLLQEIADMLERGREIYGVTVSA
jgi:hypothetical protein